MRPEKRLSAGVHFRTVNLRNRLAFLDGDEGLIDVQLVDKTLHAANDLGQLALIEIDEADGAEFLDQRTVIDQFSLHTRQLNSLRGQLHSGHDPFRQFWRFADFAFGERHSADRAIRKFAARIEPRPDYVGMHRAVILDTRFRNADTFRPRPAIPIVLDRVPIGNCQTYCHQHGDEPQSYFCCFENEFQSLPTQFWRDRIWRNGLVRWFNRR